MRLGRPAEAVAVLQPARRGEVDASNLYITRTELHEALAQAFDALGRSDSATVHYRAVVKAWEKADAPFRDRLEGARRRIEAYASRASRSQTPPLIPGGHDLRQ